MAITSVASVEEQEVEMFEVIQTPFDTPAILSQLDEVSFHSLTCRYRLGSDHLLLPVSWQGLYFYMTCFRSHHFAELIMLKGILRVYNFSVPHYYCFFCGIITLHNMELELKVFAGSWNIYCLL